MNTALVGYTGFVGSNLASSYKFSSCYNSQNIEEAFHTHPDLLVYSGVRAEKYLANQNPENDLRLINEAFKNIVQISPAKLVLISTIDVYKTPISVDEDSVIDVCGLQPYGANRYFLETKVREVYKDCLIIRLPGLFGTNIKKNFIYDFIHIIPTMIRGDKYKELAIQDPTINAFYTLSSNGFYKCNPLDIEEKVLLKKILKKIGFTALNFTDSRGLFQFYNLSHLWEHVCFALQNNIHLMNMATEPIQIKELYHYLTDNTFENHISPMPPQYDFKSLSAEAFGGKNGYIYDKEFVMSEIKNFVQEQNINETIHI